MKEYSAKTVDDCLAAAAKELGVEADDLVYTVKEEKKGLFKKSAKIDVYDQSDAVSYGETYLVGALKALGIEATVQSTVEDDIIKMTVNSERNPVLIGKNGRTLQAFNELVRLAVSNKFRHRYRILLDVGGYKEDKYSRIAYIAKRTANDVLKSHVDVKMDPMTPDERRVVHNTLNGMEHIKTESSGEGMNRAVTVKYIAGPAEAKPQEAPAPVKPVVEEPKAEDNSATEAVSDNKAAE